MKDINQGKYGTLQAHQNITVFVHELNLRPWYGISSQQVLLQFFDSES
jgi:hypothetical protein